LLGLMVIGVIAAILATCVALYAKAFTRSVPVTLQIDQVDNAFQPQAEVRLRGVTVGEVTAIHTDGHLATVSLSLQSDMVRHIPSNVTARLLPRSLFADQYLALEVPPHPSPNPIRAGDTITTDRSSDAVRTEQVLKHLLPILQAIRPAELATTLGALSQALSGRGVQLGDTISQLHYFLSQINHSLPDLTTDLNALPRTTESLSHAAPDLIEGLRNLTVTARTLNEKQDDVAILVSTLTDTSDKFRDFLIENNNNLITLVSAAKPSLDLAARYSPEYVCLFRQGAAAVPLVNTALGAGTPRPALHITVKIVATRGKFEQHRDEPEYTDKRGPACDSNTAPLPQYPGGAIQDGSSRPPPSPQAAQLGRVLDTDRISTEQAHTQPPVPLRGRASGSAPNSDNPVVLPAERPRALGEPSSIPQAMGNPVPVFTADSLSVANSVPERQLVTGLLADITGTKPASMPDWSSLLVGILLRGADVAIS